MSRKSLSAKELEEAAQTLFDSDGKSEIDPFHSSGSADSDYEPSDTEIEENELKTTSDGAEESSSDEDEFGRDEEEQEVQHGVMN